MPDNTNTPRTPNAVGKPQSVENLTGKTVDGDRFVPAKSAPDLLYSRSHRETNTPPNGGWPENVPARDAVSSDSTQGSTGGVAVDSLRTIGRPISSAGSSADSTASSTAGMSTTSGPTAGSGTTGTAGTAGSSSAV